MSQQDLKFMGDYETDKGVRVTIVDIINKEDHPVWRAVRFEKAPPFSAKDYLYFNKKGDSIYQKQETEIGNLKRQRRGVEEWTRKK